MHVLKAPITNPIKPNRNEKTFIPDAIILAKFSICSKQPLAIQF